MYILKIERSDKTVISVEGSDVDLLMDSWIC